MATKLTNLYGIPYRNEDQFNKAMQEHNEKIENLIRRNFTPRYHVAFHGGMDAEADTTQTYFDSSDDADAFICSINGWIECLAIKDGVDAVRYGNGNFGFVAYYNGHEDYLEIIPA